MDMEKEYLKCWIAGWVDHPLEAWGLRRDVAVSLAKSFRDHSIRAHLHYHACPGSEEGPEALQLAQEA